MPRAPKPAIAPDPDAPAMPAWFNETKHFRSTFGIHDTATGALLDADGQPQSAAVRAAMAREAGAEASAPESNGTAQVQE